MENKWERRKGRREASPALHLNITHTEGDKILAAAVARISRKKWPKLSEPCRRRRFRLLRNSGDFRFQESLLGSEEEEEEEGRK